MLTKEEIKLKNKMKYYIIEKYGKKCKEFHPCCINCFAWIWLEEIFEEGYEK